MIKEETLTRDSRRRAIIASVIGNALEWFDFGVYGVFSVIISKLFFPTSDPTALMLVATATFGVAFVVRPVGGVLLGIYADRAGRKAALSMIILMMAVGTGMIGVLPTYAAIGLAAPILMIVARMLQGFSAGGEYASATAMLVEFATPQRRGFIGSFQMCSQALSFALGGGVAYLITHNLTPGEVEQWGWRIPFLLGALIGPVGYYIRSKIDDSPEFTAFMQARAQRTNVQKLSLMDVLRNYPRQLMSSFGVVIVGTVSAYVVLIYVPLAAAAQLGIPASAAQFAMFMGACCLFVLCPLAGWLSDVYGRRRVMLPAVLLYGALAYPLLSTLVASPSAVNIFWYEFASCCLMSFFWGPSPIVLAEAFPVQIRSTGMSLVYNLGAMIFGGLAPFFITTLIKLTGNKLSVVYYVEASVVIGVLAILMIGERTRMPMAAHQT